MLNATYVLPARLVGALIGPSACMQPMAAARAVQLPYSVRLVA